MLTAFLLVTGLSLVFLLHCAVVGRAMLGRFPLPLHDASGVGGDGAWMAFFSICLGMLANIAGLFALGMLGKLHLAGVGGLGLLMFVLGLAGLGGLRWKPVIPTESVTARRIHALQLATLAVVFLLTMVSVLHPPGHWDDTMYQLPLARHYVEQQGVDLQAYLRFPLFPQNFNLLFALGMMLGDLVQPAQAGVWRFGAPEYFAQAFAGLPVFVMTLGLWAASRRYMGSGLPGLLAGLTLYAIRPVKNTLGFAYIDDGLALFCLAATLAVAWAAEVLPNGRGVETGSEKAGGSVRAHVATAESRRFIGACVLAGLLAGGACGTKYFGVVLASLLGGVILVLAALRARRTPGVAPLPSVLGAGAVYAAAVLLTGSWWYVRSFLVSGDPVHPAGGSVFGFFLWDQADLAFQHAEQAMHGVGRNPLMLPLALREAGVLLWLPALAGLFLRRLAPALRVLQAVFVAYVLFWFFVTQVYRYLAPVYGVGSLLAFHALGQAWVWLRNGRKRGAADPARRPGEWTWAWALLLAVAVGYASERGVRHGTRFLEAERELADDPGYLLYQQANRHPELGARLVQVGFEGGIYFFRGTVIGDWFGPGRYRDILECPRLPCALPAPENLRATLQKHGARMLLLSREAVVDLDEAVLQATGWQVLASNAKGILLASP